MGILMEIGFGTRKRPGLKVKGKSIRESLIEYLNKEIEIAEKLKNIAKIEIDPSKRMADLNLENNTWEKK